MREGQLDLELGPTMSRRSLLKAALAAPTGIVAGSVLPEQPVVSAASRAAELLISDSSSLNKLDIAYLDDTMDGLNHGPISDWLLQIDENFGVHPGLAEPWETNKSGTAMGDRDCAQKLTAAKHGFEAFIGGAGAALSAGRERRGGELSGDRPVVAGPRCPRPAASHSPSSDFQIRPSRRWKVEGQ